MIEADESYDGTMKRAHRAEQALDVAIRVNIQQQAKVRELEAELAEANKPISYWRSRLQTQTSRNEDLEAEISRVRARAEKAELEGERHLKTLIVTEERAKRAEADYASACATLMSVGSRLDGEIETRQRAEARVVAHIIEDARQWGYDEPVIELSSPTAGALFASSKALAIYKWLKQVESDGGSK